MSLPTQRVRDARGKFDAVVIRVTVEVQGLKPRETVSQIAPGWLPDASLFRSEIEGLARDCADSLWQETHP